MLSSLHRLLVISVLVLAAILVIGIALRPGERRKPVRIARHNFQARFTESIFNEIARRRKIPVVWVQTGLNAPEALRQNVVDIWAGAVDRGAQQEFHQTEKWTNIEFSLLSIEAKDQRHPAPTAGRLVAYPEPGVNISRVNEALPGAVPMPFGSVVAAVQAVCNGKAHAVMLARNTALEAILAATSTAFSNVFT